MRSRLSILVLAIAALAFVPAAALAAGPLGNETNCGDGQDGDGDGLPDCADSDCEADPTCKPDGGAEANDARCSDWIDNDEDGAVDCDDMDCQGPGIKTCKGSWVVPMGGGSAPAEADLGDMPELGEGMSVEDLLGKGGDIDGERNDNVCSDGIDNDGDGKTDCADFGCRFDPSVTVCRGNPGMRFSVVANVAQTYDVEAEQWDTRFTKLQLRALGPINPIQDSFFLLSMRAEKTPRLTFAMFQVPVGGGHFININSGGGGLSMQPVLSESKQLLIDRAFYVYSAFQQGNGAALEVFGPMPILKGVQYRAYGGGGTGRFTGNIGGRFLPDDSENYAYSFGGQLTFNIFGHYSRWDSPFLYTPAPLTLGMDVGAKYDQTAYERYPAANVRLVLRYNRVVAIAESYSKRELEFGSWQNAYNVQVGVLVWSKHLMVAADFGEFIAGAFDDPPSSLPSDLRKQVDTREARAAMHWYFWRNIGMVSLVFKYHREGSRSGGGASTERELKAVAQFRF
jgi:hypothetical protein